ncbi:uncharacterized protein LOC128454907 [Pleuronectes platessa]|uniref:uncharacterized protein LOC128454907 n=1 Tax=Pleuronectes platessa TaxID=8262 RepID=UPI00232A441D|nr:uncharacterized protein LOC128454907 [Pleuronectes platessa]
MHPIILLFVISLLQAYEARGSDTGTPVFVQKGKDLILNVTAPVKLVEDSELKWKFNGSGMIRLFHDNKIKLFDPYKGRVEIFLQNHSLLLKKVQQADSGLYSAGVYGDNDTYVGKYIVTVQDPVSLVTGTVDLLSSSSDSCNLTVTCSTQDSHHIISTFRCDPNTCSHEEGGEWSKVTTSGSSLRVYLSKNFSVICSHSNQVSSDEHTTMIRDFCFKHPGSDTWTHVFVQKGKDLLLNVTAPVKLVKRSDFRWKFNGSSIIRLFHDNETEIMSPYDGRVVIFLQNQSLLLKNVQQADSGRYTAAVAATEINYVGKYSVTVQDPVSLVTGTVDLLSSSSDSCNLTVTCSTQDSHNINSTFRCDTNTCSQEEGGERSKVTTSGSSLYVYLSKGVSVICSHSNQVSSDEHTTMIRNFCFKPPGSDTGTPVFVQKGKDLILNVTAPVKLVEDSDFKWRFNGSGMIRLFHDNKIKLFDPYKGRVEIFLQNHSLLLKKVQQADSGLYTAGVYGDNDTYVGKYIVTVQDPVSLVTGTVDLLSSSSDSCNLTVTCSTQDSHHIISTFRCDPNTCSHEEGGERSKVTTSGSSLRVYLSKNFSVICSHSNQVSSDEHTTMIRDFCFKHPGSDTWTHVFVLKGKDLILNVTAPVKLVKHSELKWKFNDLNILRLLYNHEKIMIGPYDGRVEIFLQNHSLLLKNVQQADSGRYTAVVFGDNDTYVGKFIVTVQDPVSLVTGTVDLLSNSSDSCNLTVTCSTQDSHHINSTFRCEANTCSQEEGGERSKVTTSGSSPRVFLSEGVSVICSHSNQVSSDEHTTMIRDFCFKHPAPEPQSNIIAFVNMTVIKVLVIIAISAAFVGYRIKGKHETEDKENTVYENVQVQSVNTTSRSESN